MNYKWTVANGAYSVQNRLPVSVNQAKSPTVDSGIETALDRREFAQANAVIDYIKNLK